jgi:homoserine O-acetyltransferase
VLSIGDSVASQSVLADRLSIDRFHGVVGGCFGGFQALEWMVRHPARVGSAVVISATPRTSAHNTGLWAVFRHAIRSDPAWCGGDYYDSPTPADGIGLASMFGALFWMSRDTMATKFGLQRIQGDAPEWGFEPEYTVEGFLDSVGRNAADRIDPNALLYLTRAIDYFDLSRGRKRLSDAFASYRAPTLLVSYEADWRYPPGEMDEIAVALRDAGAPCRHDSLDSTAGHGGYLYDVAGLAPLLTTFLAAPATALQAA